MGAQVNESGRSCHAATLLCPRRHGKIPLVRLASRGIAPPKDMPHLTSSAGAILLRPTRPPRQAGAHQCTMGPSDRVDDGKGAEKVTRKSTLGKMSKMSILAPSRSAIALIRLSPPPGRHAALVHPVEAPEHLVSFLFRESGARFSQGKGQPKSMIWPLWLQTASPRRLCLHLRAWRGRAIIRIHFDQSSAWLFYLPARLSFGPGFGTASAVSTGCDNLTA